MKKIQSKRVRKETKASERARIGLFNNVRRQRGQAGLWIVCTGWYREIGRRDEKKTKIYYLCNKNVIKRPKILKQNQYLHDKNSMEVVRSQSLRLFNWQISLHVNKFHRMPAIFHYRFGRHYQVIEFCHSHSQVHWQIRRRSTIIVANQEKKIIAYVFAKLELFPRLFFTQFLR